MNFLIAHIGHTSTRHEHVVWWKPDSCGYTACVDKAGRYTIEEAEDICRTGLCIAVAESVAQDLAKTTPYYRRADGSLKELYDGGPHRPVPNSKECWTILKRRKVFPSGEAKVAKTTTIGTRARSIYLE